MSTDRVTRISFDLYVITDRHQCRGSLLEVVEAAAEAAGGRAAFQLREKDITPENLLSLSREVLEICRRHDCPLLINHHLEIALDSRADGLHLSRRSAESTQARGLVPEGFLLGASVHGVEEATEPGNNAADFLVLGPVFHTPSKEQYGDPIGLQTVRQVKRQTMKPVIAIGGIKAENVGEVYEAGADGVAVISAVMAAKDPGAATANLLEAIDVAQLHAASR